MLTIKKLKEMKPGIFDRGDTAIGGFFKWVAVRGGIHDWAIYKDSSDKTWDEVKSYGNKVYSEEEIRNLVPCDDEAFKMYRH